MSRYWYLEYPKTFTETQSKLLDIWINMTLYHIIGGNTVVLNTGFKYCVGHNHVNTCVIGLIGRP
jgi:hypothetical protein